ncbi:MAG: tyrosine-type recombinase/integrase [Gemmobacter sp.]
MRRDMGRPLKHIQRIVRGGRVLRYLRAPGTARVRLPDLPEDDPAFVAAYLAAMNGAPAQRSTAAPGTIGALCEAYLRTAEHAGQSPDYRRVIRREIEAIRATGGKARTADLASRHIAADVSSLSPHAGVARLKAWRLLCRYGASVGALADDPARTVRQPRTPRTDGHAPWTAAEIARFRARWPFGTVERAAMELLHWTGARIGDAVLIGPQHVGDDGVLTYRQSKTGDLAYCPWTCALPAYAAPIAPDRAMMHAALEARPSGHLTWLATSAGTRSKEGLGNLVTAACQSARVARSAHGLRKTRAVALADLGASALQIAAWTGHRTLKEVERYTSAANRRALVTGTDPERGAVKI